MSFSSFSVQGAWARRSVSIDGGPRFETQRVVWLQAGPCYADLRVPFHPAAQTRCFAGRSGWDGDGYRWGHRLDLDGPDSPAGDDLGRLGWRDGLLIEQGWFPTADGPVAYQEDWAPLAGGDGPSLAAEAPGAQMVRVGRHAIGVVNTDGLFRARYWVLGPAGWAVEATIGDGAGVPSPDHVPPDWTLAHAGDTKPVAVCQPPVMCRAGGVLAPPARHRIDGVAR